MKLSIIIPHYQEVFTLRRLLESFDSQIGVDFDDIEIIVINDGPDAEFAYTEALKSTGFRYIHPKCIDLPENKGPGLARQAGTDIAVGDWITFCDADDMPCGYTMFMNYLEAMGSAQSNSGIKIISFTWLEELPKSFNSRDRIIPHSREMLWLHAKLFRRSFLVDNDIKFSERLTTCGEDSYFMAIVCMYLENMQKNVLNVDAISWIWNYNEKSLTRSNPLDYTLVNFRIICEATVASIEYCEKHKPDKFLSYLESGLASIYGNSTLNFFILDRTASTYCTKEDIRSIRAEYGSEITRKWNNYINFDNVRGCLPWALSQLESQHSIRLPINYNDFDSFVKDISK